MRMTRRDRCRGSNILEFTLVGIPLLFILISTFEMARGMWNYHAMAYAVKEGTRYASVHGTNCAAPNACTVTIAQITQRILDSGAGLFYDQLTLTFTSTGGSITCLATTCLTNNTVWPQVGSNAVGQNITIRGTYPFTSAISMFWPGSGGAMQAASTLFPASSRETVQF